jgi:hypothetical protein
MNYDGAKQYYARFDITFLLAELCHSVDITRTHNMFLITFSRRHVHATYFANNYFRIYVAVRLI